MVTQAMEQIASGRMNFEMAFTALPFLIGMD